MFAWHIIIRILVSMTLSLMQGHSSLTKENIKRWIISRSKEAIGITCAVTIGRNVFWFSPKFSVAFIWNYGHTCIVLSVPACFPSALLATRRKTYFSASLRHDVKRVPLHPTTDVFTGKTNTSFGDCFVKDQRGKQSPKLVFVLPVDVFTRADTIGSV